MKQKLKQQQDEIETTIRLIGLKNHGVKLKVVDNSELNEMRALQMIKDGVVKIEK